MVNAVCTLKTHFMYAVRLFQELVECLEVNNHCPKLLTRALLPEAAMEHALRAVQADDRVRRWKPDAGSLYELQYICARGQVDWINPYGMLYFALPFPALPCPALPCPALPCRLLSSLVVNGTMRASLNALHTPICATCLA